MDLNELSRLTLPKLRDLAKRETDIQGVIGMEKEALIEAVAKAKGISYDESAKDVNAIRSIKHEIRDLRKRKAEGSGNGPVRKSNRKLNAEIRRLKRLTRHLAHETMTAAAVKAAQAKTEEAKAAAAAAAAKAAAAKEAAAQPAAPAETPPAAE